VAPPQTTFSWAGTTAPPSWQAQNKVFSGIEIRDILVAWLGLGVAFAFALSGGGLTLLLVGPGALYLLLISLVTVGPGFVLHELSHKFAAQRYGYWAEFRMWPMMLVLALLTALAGFVFAAPGATYISGANISESQNGKISLAGPLTNIVIGAAFIPLYLQGGLLHDIGLVGSRINIILATFNMIPFGPLDGAKVFRWNFALWVLVFIPLFVAAYYSFFFIR
jgi:Zn-dependent protease